jgi:hypothetical protein
LVPATETTVELLTVLMENRTVSPMAPKFLTFKTVCDLAEKQNRKSKKAKTEIVLNDLIAANVLRHPMPQKAKFDDNRKCTYSRKSPYTPYSVDSQLLKSLHNSLQIFKTPYIVDN